MFLKRISIHKNGKRHTYWALVKSVRTPRGPRHQVVSYLGELGPDERAAWANVGRVVKQPRQTRLRLFDAPVPLDPVPEKVEFLEKRGGRYLVGTPKSMLRSIEKELLEKNWTEVEAGVEARLCQGPQGKETFIVCRSRARREKERAMHDRFEKRIEDDLTRLATRLQRAKKKPDSGQVERQIGRMPGRNSRAAGLFEITVRKFDVTVSRDISR